MLSHAIAVGAGCFRFTVAFSLGPRSFSSLNLTIHPSETISRFYLGAEGKRSGHRLSSQPVDRFSRALRRGNAPGPSSRSYLARRMSLGEVAFLDWAVSFGEYIRDLPSSLVFPVYRGRQDSFRELPFLLSYGFGKLSRGRAEDFSRARGGASLTTWEVR